MRTDAGYVQLYLRVKPGILAAPCMRDLTTWVTAVRVGMCHDVSFLTSNL